MKMWWHLYLFCSPIAMLTVQMPHSLLTVFTLFWTFLSTKYEKVLTFHFLIFIQITSVLSTLMPLNVPANSLCLDVKMGNAGWKYWLEIFARNFWQCILAHTLRGNYNYTVEKLRNRNFPFATLTLIHR